MKTTVRYGLTLTTTTVKKTATSEESGTLTPAGRNVKRCGGHFGKQLGSSPKCYTKFPHNPRFLSLRLHPRELKAHVHINTYAQMFTEALFVTARK